MISAGLGEIPESDWSRLQKLVGQFETAWIRSERPRIVDYLPDDARLRPTLLVELVHADLEFRIKAGEPAQVEDYLRDFPALTRNPQALLGLIRAEWSLRRRKDSSLSIDEYRARFPKFRVELEAESPDAASTIASPIAAADPVPRLALLPEGPLPRKLGKFELRERVGVGSFGVVYRAWDTVLNREVALKIPRPEAMAAPSDVRAFLREARNAIELRHPHIVEILDAGPIEGTFCVVRAFIEGITLAERLKASSISTRESASIMATVGEALELAHSRKIIHRDLKPSNILLDLEGRPHVCDFGLAKRGSNESSIGSINQAGAMIGTPAYMSPEQARGEGDLVDARTDVYSMGVVLYELLTGSVPFRGRGRRLQIQIEEAEPVSPRALSEEVPAGLETICLRALSKRPSARYQSALEMAADLRNFLKGVPIGNPPKVKTLWVRSLFREYLIIGLIAALTVVTVFWIAAEAHRCPHVKFFEPLIP